MRTTASSTRPPSCIGRDRLRHGPRGAARGAGCGAAGAGLHRLGPAVARYKASQCELRVFGTHNDACKHALAFLGTHRGCATRCTAPLLACALTARPFLELRASRRLRRAGRARSQACCARRWRWPTCSACTRGPRPAERARLPGGRRVRRQEAVRNRRALAHWLASSSARAAAASLPRSSATMSGAHTLVSSGVLGAQRWRAGAAAVLGPAAGPERARRRAWWSRRAGACPALHICLRQAAVGGKAAPAVRGDSADCRAQRLTPGTCLGQRRHAGRPRAVLRQRARARPRRSA